MARGWYSSSRDQGASTWAPYVSVAARRKHAERDVLALRKKGRTICPVVIEGRKITATFWGIAWCTNLESYSDYENRLPRGRSYVRNGSVVHLEISEGKVEALVRGTSMYTVKIAVASLAKPRWKAVVAECSGQVTSLIELLQGKLSQGVMEVVTRRDRGLFPNPKEISLACSCPDWATMCKHVAAVMYGVGARLDAQPELLFRLRALDPAELLSKAAVGRASKTARVRGRTLDEGSLANVFGIDIDEGAAARAAAPRKTPASRVVKKRPAPQAKRRRTTAR